MHDRSNLMTPIFIRSTRRSWELSLNRRRRGRWTLQPGLDTFFVLLYFAFYTFMFCERCNQVRILFDMLKIFWYITKAHIWSYFCRSLERDLERLKADHATEVKDKIIILFMYCTMILRLDDDSSIYLGITSFYVSLS